MSASLNGIRCLFLDLDGTIYLGDELIEGALEFLNRCDEQGVKRFFLSNNSSRSVIQYVEKLQGMGIPAKPEEIMLSTHHLLAHLLPELGSDVRYDSVFLVGTQGMREMLEEAGINTNSERPKAVVIGYDTEIDYHKIATASKHLHAGVPLIASHPDVVCPSPDGGLPDVGAYLAMFEAATGVVPSLVCGKPRPGMIAHKIRELGVEPSECGMVGDRLYTDMEMAERAGVRGILVLSGEATLEDLEEAQQNPDLVVDSVDELLR